MLKLAVYRSLPNGRSNRYAEQDVVRRVCANAMGYGLVYRTSNAFYVLVSHEFKRLVDTTMTE